VDFPLFDEMRGCLALDNANEFSSGLGQLADANRFAFHHQGVGRRWYDVTVGSSTLDLEADHTIGRGELDCHPLPNLPDLLLKDYLLHSGPVQPNCELLLFQRCGRVQADSARSRTTHRVARVHAP